MASGNSAQSAAHQQNISIQFSFYQRTVYETSTHPPKPCGSKKEDAGLRIRAHEQIIQREAGRMARYTTRCLESIIHGRLPINTELLDLDYILLIGKQLLETWEQRKRANELIAPRQMVKTQLLPGKRPSHQKGQTIDIVLTCFRIFSADIPPKTSPQGFDSLPDVQMS
ncbi:hypothetical protein BBK36DRAFT_19436 [Trichoderma citrinoviride]|uniref:Uncharacterized protein n=1 Tax=Trichoderma citrinoviride TaxID=58853 RepID=A0A2T4BBV5_9HYPO|nr:hypothetical protein BBK36DRAFT_19436 [Trichoderma citrinoviride]PTB66816.1 hypothetical protein BBK36DRAFT_19436 [Trichoderma citrinoviride]